MTYIYTHPFTRINEVWADNSIDFSAPAVSVKHPLIKGDSNCTQTQYQANFYKYIAVDFVTETVYNYRYPYISEKTLRPIACKRLFVIIGAPGTLELLHSKNFQTFPDVFDESYDAITDPIKRWHALTKVINDFLKKPLTEIVDLVNLSSPILNHNFEVLKNLQQHEINTLNDTN